MEIWRAIVGTKGFIEVSNEGRVRSLLKGKPRVLKTQLDKNQQANCSGFLTIQSLNFGVAGFVSTTVDSF